MSNVFYFIYISTISEKVCKFSSENLHSNEKDINKFKYGINSNFFQNSARIDDGQFEQYSRSTIIKILNSMHNTFYTTKFIHRGEGEIIIYIF